MDLSHCNDAQKRVISTIPGPLFVAAGAGSGKTFTLKLRTANAFLGTESGFKLDSIHQLLAITFTDKAAQELLTRIKDALFAEGFADQARQADSAWISTIHGFCSRLLRENALEIGLDPEFKMISERETMELTAQAREAVLQQVRSGEIDLAHTAWNWSLLGAGEFVSGLLDDALELRRKVGAMPAGSDAFVSFASSFAPGDALRSMKVLAEALLADVPRWSKDPAKYEQARLDAIPLALEAADTWLCSDQAALAFEDDRFDREGFKEVIETFPVLSATFGKKKATEDIVSRYKDVHGKLIFGAYGTFGLEAAQVALELAKAYNVHYDRLKQERGLVDNDDLLQMALKALAAHPALAERYRDQFKLIMVDEFQDTDKVQIALLKLLAQPGLANVCVVGDAQQSIYRFRGADVGAFKEYRSEIAAAHPELTERQLQPQLTENFRSHRDILAFVDAVFSQASSFGSAYLKLTPKGAINDLDDPVMDESPRVTVDVQHYKGSEGVEEQERALWASARRIAQHFSDIKQAYKEAEVTEKHTFALLLGRTKHADVYIAALREAGLESLMTAGSILAASDEAKTLKALLRYAVNTSDEQALLDCLTSDLFAISDDILLALAFYRSGDALKHGSLAAGFRDREHVQALGLAGSSAQALLCAQEVLGGFVTGARRQALSSSVRRALVASGYLDRMQGAGAEGIASVGNWSKLMGMLEEVERDGGGFVEAVRAFESKLMFAKESPGVLSVTESDFVQIMTIHGSKGLQFDHVAVAELKTSGRSTMSFLAENQGGHTYALSKKGMSPPAALTTIIQQRAEDAGIKSLSEVETPAQLFYMLNRVSKEESAGEARRLLYVGLTRAVRSLYLSYLTNSLPHPQNGAPYSRDGIFKEVHEALYWDTAGGSYVDTTTCGYGGTLPAKIVFTVGEVEEEAPGVNVAQEPQDFLVPVRPQAIELQPVPFVGARADVRSYSSLDHGLVLPDLPKEEGGETPLADVRFSEMPEEDATALGTAFHRLAQLAIINRDRTGTHHLERPHDEAVQAQVQKLKVTGSQEARLNRALDTWFASPQAQELCEYDGLEAEVPFMVQLPRSDEEPLYLEGEIDALATTGDVAFFVDYKTGGSEQETAEQIRAKHELQAQCYAYALLRSGFKMVKATFVRVEQLSKEGMPQTVTYEFSAGDTLALERTIRDHWPSI